MRRLETAKESLQAANKARPLTRRRKAPPPQKSSRPAIIFVHYHKAGGTSVCETMRLHQNQVNITNVLGEQPDPYQLELNNCNTEFTHPHLDDRAFSAVQNCRMLEPYTMDKDGVPFRRNNFLGVEIPLHDPLPCPKFRNFAIMRDPVKRCISHLLFEQATEDKVEKWMDEKTPGTRKDFAMNGYSVINNFVIRMLLGRRRFISPNPINERDLEQAKKLVDKFDAFVPLEYLQDEKVLTLLNKTVPEYHQGLMNNKGVRSNQQPPTNLKYSNRVIERIREENAYDTKLYDYMLDKLGLPSTQHNDVSMKVRVK